MTHGTITAYRNHGCRCGPCRTAQRVANARNRANRFASGRVTHGTRSGYDAGCRCADYRAVRNSARIWLDEDARASAARRERTAARHAARGLHLYEAGPEWLMECRTCRVVRRFPTRHAAAVAAGRHRHVGEDA